MRHAILILVLSVLLASCATTKTPLPTDNIDELLGTWVNTEYDGVGRTGKWVWKADGIVSVYRKSTYDRSYTDPKWEIKEKWKAANGAIYLVVFCESMGSHARSYHFSIRLSPDRSYYEMMVHYGELPLEIDPNAPEYCIYYRQK